MAYDETTGGIQRYGVSRWWTTATRPTPSTTDPYPFGFNVTVKRLEYWDGDQWVYVKR